MKPTDINQELLNAAKCALADLEGIMPEFEPSGDREHPGWTTIKELKAAIKKASGDREHPEWMTIKELKAVIRKSNKKGNNQ